MADLAEPRLAASEPIKPPASSVGIIGWLRANPDSPHAGDVRAKADRARTYRLRGWRATMGLAYVTLQAP